MTDPISSTPFSHDDDHTHHQMSFGWGYGATWLFRGWRTETEGDMALACCGLVIVCILYHLLEFFVFWLKQTPTTSAQVNSQQNQPLQLQLASNFYYHSCLR